MLACRETAVGHWRAGAAAMGLPLISLTDLSDVRNMRAVEWCQTGALVMRLVEDVSLW